MEKNSDRLTLENLNAAYLKLIKLFMQGSLPSRTPQLTRFLNDPSPSEAYSIINQICPLEKKPESPPPEIKQLNPSAFQLKKTYTQTFQSNDKIQKDYVSSFSKEMQSEKQIKISHHSSEEEKGSNGKEKEAEKWNKFSKSQQLRSITNRLAELFSSNQKKIEKYEKNNTGQSNDYLGKANFLKPVEQGELKRY